MGTKSQREGAYPNPSLKGRALLRRWCTAHGGLFWGSQRDKERKSGREEGKEKLWEGKEKLEEGKEKFEEGKEKFEEGKEKLEEGKF